MQFEGQVGYQFGASGSKQPLRLGPENALIVADGQARYTEGGRTHRAFAGIISGYTAIATTIPLAAAGTPMAALYNPIGSNTILEIVREMFATRSGTAGGTILRQVSTSQNSITATPTSANVRAAGIGDTGVRGPTGRFFTAVALTGSLALVNDVGFGAPGTAPALPVDHDTGGNILIFPGGVVAWVTTSAGTTWLLDGQVSWRELPMISPE